MQHLSDQGVYLSKTSGILVGALKPVHLSNEAQKNVMTALLCPDNRMGNCLSDVAHECRSIYFTTENGRMLYRVGENVIVSGEHEGVINIIQFLWTTLDGKNHIFVVGECFQPVMNGSQRGVCPVGQGSPSFSICYRNNSTVIKHLAKSYAFPRP